MNGTPQGKQVRLLVSIESKTPRKTYGDRVRREAPLHIVVSFYIEARSPATMIRGRAVTGTP